MTDTTTPTMLRTRLSLMMFLQYAIWGAWLPILYPFLLGHRQFSLDQVGAILAAGAAGAIVGPFIAGQIADRHFSTERFLAVSHLIGAGLVFGLAAIDSFWAFLAVSIFYGIVYAPTLALTNSLSFHHLPNRDRDFGPVRVWGTIGWIAAGILVGQWLAAQHSPAELREAASTARVALEQITSAGGDPAGAQAALNGATAALGDAQNAGRADAFRLSAILGVLMGFYCLTLPRTPPARNAGSKNATVAAIKECKRQPLLMLFLIAVPVSIVHQFYFVHASAFLTEIQNRTGDTALADGINTVFGVGGGGLMTIGQMTEVAVI
ncbi:MAG: MFS transporter, partial [Planctomycetota bacterium]